MNITEKQAKIVIYALYAYDGKKLKTRMKLINDIQEDLAQQDQISYLPSYTINDEEAETIYLALEDYYEAKKTGLDIVKETPNTFPTTSPEVLEAQEEEIKIIKEQITCAKKQIKIMAKLIKEMKKNFHSIRGDN